MVNSWTFWSHKLDLFFLGEGSRL